LVLVAFWLVCAVLGFMWTIVLPTTGLLYWMGFI
jgi:hypothetical protein